MLVTNCVFGLHFPVRVGVNIPDHIQFTYEAKKGKKCSLNCEAAFKTCCLLQLY